MLAIEAKRVLKDSLIIFLVLAAIIVGIIASDQDAYLAPALEIFLLLFASFTGWSLFERERQENAGEYMLSLPLSRARLLLIKILPRLLSVSFILLIYLSLHQALRLPSFLATADFVVLYSGFFLLAIAFSVSFRNFISVFFIVCLLIVGQILLILLLDPGREIASAIQQATLAVLALPLFFLFLFRSFDIRPPWHFNKKFFPGLLLITGVIAGYLFLTAPPDWKNLYLTHEGLLLKNSCKSSRIDRQDGSRLARVAGCLAALRESDDHSTLFALTRKPGEGGCTDVNLVALDLKQGGVKTIYTFAPGWSIAEGHQGEIGAYRDGTFSLLIQNAQTEKAIFLRIREGRIREFPVAGRFYDANISYILYVEDDPPQAVIYSSKRLYRLDTSGRVQELARSDALNVWQDKMLLFESSGMNLYRVDKEMTLLASKPGPYKKNRRRISGYESRSLIYHLGRDYFWMDMELEQDGRLKPKFPPYTYQQSGAAFNVVCASGSTFTMMQVGVGVPPNETIWEAGFQPEGIRLSPFGFLVFKGKEYKVYRFKN